MSAETVPPQRRLRGRRLALLDREGRSSASLRTTAGIVALVLTAVATILSGTTPVSILLAGSSVVLLAGHPSLGPLGAAALVVVIVPYDRAANGYLPRIASIPIRAQDLAIVVGLALCLPSLRLRRPTRSLAAGLLVAFLAIGLIAVVAGFAGRNDARDILRDARWWFLYGSGLLVFFLPPMARAQLLRGLLIGALGFALVVVVTSLLPAVPGGLKARAQEFDFGLLRLQYGNSVFLLLPIAWGAIAWIRGHTWALAILAITCLAVMLSLTRTLMIVAAVVVLLAAVAGTLEVLRRRGSAGVRSWPVARIVAALAVLPVTLAAGLVIISATTTATPPPGTPPPTTNGPPPEDPFGRVTFENDQSGWGSIAGGRLKTYMRALDVIQADPLGGGGMGATVVAEYEFGGEKFATPGRLPNVDNAYLTSGMKGGVPAMLVLAGLFAWPALLGLWSLRRQRSLRGLGGFGARMRRIWWLPAWLGIIALTMTQSFATTGYGPFLLGLLVVVFGRGYASMSVRRAAAQE